ncbi:MAG: histidine kinase dimerization/phospho-acceptor domain-containing protein [Pseudomonadota bacterium]
MFFDDRLATVLRQSTQSDAMRRTQYRQLLDLLGAQTRSVRKATSDPSLIAAAWMRMNKLAEMISGKDRAQLIGEPSWRLRNPELVAHLADFEPDVASAALSRAQLSADDWTALIPRLPVRARGFLRLRRDLPDDVQKTLEQLGIYDRGLPTPQAQPEEVSAELGSSTADDEPLDLDPTDALPGTNIPPEDLPTDPFSITPTEPLRVDSNENDQNAPAPTRPIFFPKVKAKDAQIRPASEQQDFTPQPFTIEELREIAQEPLGTQESPREDPGEKEIPPKDEIAEPRIPPNELASQDEGRSEISALVERISNFRRSRTESSSRGDRVTDAVDDNLADNDRLMPRLPLGEDDNNRLRIVRGFSFAADAAGRIEWAGEDVASMVVGARLVAPAKRQISDADLTVATAFSQRQPINAAPFTLHGAPAISGDWIVDAQPRFNQIGGFSGYVGRMRRPLKAAPSAVNPAQREADRIRQLLHELRTPVTAVQGYSEVIQQQLFGSAPHEYRALAAAIASDAARILSGFEELDRLARLETGVIEIDEGRADIAALTKRFIHQLAQVLNTRMAGFDLAIEEETVFVAAIEEDSVESLLWRTLASVGGGCATGEMLQTRLELAGDLIRLTCDLPTQLLGENDLFAADARPLSTAINPGLFGAGFALRLARAEARAAGGNLVRNKEAIVLTLPKASDDTGAQDIDLAQR